MGSFVVRRPKYLQFSGNIKNYFPVVNVQLILLLRYILQTQYVSMRLRQLIPGQLISRQLNPVELLWDQLLHLNHNSATIDHATIDPIYFTSSNTFLELLVVIH